MATPITEPDKGLIERLTAGEFKFIDLGCGTGGSIKYCEGKFKLPPGSGCGLDLNEKKIAKAKADGAQVMVADVIKTPLPAGCVSFVSMMDFLEHLPSELVATTILKRAGEIAKDFIFIRHPSFEDVEYLARFGLKIDWTDWRGHRNMMRLGNFERVFAALGWPEYVIIPQKQIFDSSHPAVVPLTAPGDTVRYNRSLHGEKPQVTFNRPVYTQFDILVRLNPKFDQTRWQEIISVFSAWDEAERMLENYRRELAKCRELEQQLGRLKSLPNLSN